MENIIVKKLSESPETLKALYSFSATKYADAKYCFTMQKAIHSLHVLIEFFNKTYNIDIVFSSNNIIAKKGNIEIVNVREEIPFDVLFCIFLTLLIEHCEKPF